MRQRLLLLQHLRDALDRSRSFEDFQTHVEPVFTELLRSGYVEEALQADLEALAGASATGEPTDSLLFDDGRCRLGVGPGLTRTAGPLSGNSSHQLGGVLRGRVVVERYRHTREQDPAILDPECALERLPDLALHAGDTLAVEAWREVVEPYGDALILFLRSSPVHGTQWIYDRETLRPTGFVLGDRTISRLLDTLTLLSHVGTAKDADVCVRLARHPAHAVRWEAIRTAAAMGHPDAPALVEAAAQDPHPEIREAAAAAQALWS